MVTKYSTSPELYDILFKKATEKLRKVSGYDDDFEIQTLEEYFACLRDLIYGKTEIPSLDSYAFLKLPLDEPHFVIKANSRQIEVPEDFKKNGLGVVGDETAEIVFFEIDRFYDSVDLYKQDIVIQWQTGDDNKTVHQSPAFMKLLCMDENGDEKIVFGWPITSQMTSSPGKIIFSVRFYTQEGADSGGASIFDPSANKKTQFSWSTLSAETFINSSISINASTGVTVDDQSKLILARIPMSEGVDTNIQPTEPYYVFASAGNEQGQLLQPIALTSTGALQYRITEDIAENGITLAVLADKSGAGVLKYTWGKDIDGSKVESGPYKATLENGIYVPVESYIEGYGAYYHKNPVTSQFYYKCYFSAGEFLEGCKDYGKAYVFCYKITLGGEQDNDFLTAPGTYYSQVKNTLRANETFFDQTQSPPAWEIVGPQVPTLSAITALSGMPEKKEGTIDGRECVHYKITNNGTFSIGAEGTDSNTQWTWSRGDSPDHMDEVVATEQSFGYQQSVIADGYYVVTATNRKNKGTATATSQPVFISSAITDIATGAGFEVTDQLVATIVHRELEKFETKSYQWYDNLGQAIQGATDPSLQLVRGKYYSCVITVYKGLLTPVSTTVSGIMVPPTINVD